ncbi:unnamed protein product [Lathyrus oleraceus]|uniref:Uncharacterized protein n=2 Tax=Pisum sativum TaxID=3888 RepID=A0A9D5B1U6_PEA|nr:hypothetical protein KIW84_032151 [Pisum sativum]
MALAGSATFSSSLSSVCTLQNRHASQSTTFLGIPLCQSMFLTKKKPPHRFLVVAVTKGSTESSKSDEKIPSWAKPDSEEPPPWAQNEAQNKTASSSEQGFEIPFYVYLLASAITAIAAIGSIFEYVNQKPVFGVLSSDSIFYAPLLGFFAITGVPTSAFLWFKSVEAANKEAEEQDKRDGYK